MRPASAVGFLPNVLSGGPRSPEAAHRKGSESAEPSKDSPVLSLLTSCYVLTSYDTFRTSLINGPHNLLFAHHL